MEDMKFLFVRESLESTKESSKETPSKSSDEDEEEEDEDDESLVLENLVYPKLQTNPNAYKIENICSVCELPSSLIGCIGSCQKWFHLDCLGLFKEPNDGYKCNECIHDSHLCFLCKKESEITVRKCAVSKCGKYYHDNCAINNDLFRSDKTNGYTCPHHICVTCFADVKHTNQLVSRSLGEKDDLAPIASGTLSQAVKGKFVRCVRCPLAFHVGDHCNIPGSVMLSASSMICFNHFQPIKNLSFHNRVNVSWCFVCCKNHDLIGCNNCPAAYHYQCLEKPPVHLLPSLNLNES